MSHLFYFILFLLIFSASSSDAQKKWDGEAGSNQWSDANNWTDNSLPAATDNVVLDNSFVSGSYIVELPILATTVKNISINPSGNNIIQLDLPKTNKAIPALTITGLVINPGGIFKNSSGATSGTPVVISDSIRINDDGRFIINTPRAHATNIERLSRAPGTERGVLEFDIPDASTTISLSGRTFGKLVLKSAAFGATLNYTAAGTNKVYIRSDLEIGEGVNFNLNFSDTIFVRGDLRQEKSTLNLGNTARNVVLAVGGNITQLSTGLITESGTGTQQILLNGSGEQQLNIQGQVLNQVSLVKNGPGDARLLSHLTLPFLLSLRRGNIISANDAMLMLLPECSVSADTLSSDSYVDGPLRKMGLAGSSFMFPVGARNYLRWLQLVNATGDFTVQYFRSDPTQVSKIVGNGIHHISAIEYWDVAGDNSATAAIKLSFSDPQSGGVTDVSHLRVAKLTNGEWTNAGNTDFRGAPGSNGWVSSSAAGGFSAENNFFALASAISQENPLPFSEIKLAANRARGKLFFLWEADADDATKHFELQESADNNQYRCIYTCPALPGKTGYRYEMDDTITITKYYRIKAKGEDPTNEHLSKTVKLTPEQKQSFSMNTLYVRNHLNLRISIMENKRLDFMLYNMAGHALKKVTMNIQKGTTNLKIPVTELPPGAYFLVILNGYNRLFTSKFVRGS